MSTKQSFWKRLFSSSSNKKEENDDCCGVKIKQVDEKSDQPNNTNSRDSKTSQESCCSN